MSDTHKGDIIKTILKGVAITASTIICAFATTKVIEIEKQKEKSLKQLALLIENSSRLIKNQSKDSESDNQDDNNKQPVKDNLEPELVLEQLQKNNQLIFKICITGGPCAGKTSGLALLSEKLREEGFQVFTVPEAATMISEGGGMLDISSYDEEQQINFQKALMRSQVQLEDSFMGIAKLSNNRSVILCDRGLMDGSAYLPQARWNKMLESMNITEIQIRDKRYDCVIHLVTAADGAEQFYNKDNDARHESPLEAILLDRKLQMSWLGHPNYQILDNNSVKNFEDKMNKLVNKARQVVGLPVLLNKVHKRYLLESNKIGLPEDLKVQKSFIEDIFIKNNFPSSEDSKTYTKIRRREQDTQQIYMWTQTEYNNLQQTATQKKLLTFKEYLFLFPLKDMTRQIIIKERSCFMWEGVYFILDTYLNIKEGFSLLKSKVQADQKVEIPPFLKIKREVTGEKGYTSRVLAKKNWYIPEGDEEILNIRKDSL